MKYTIILILAIIGFITILSKLDFLILPFFVCLSIYLLAKLYQNQKWKNNRND